MPKLRTVPLSPLCPATQRGLNPSVSAQEFGFRSSEFGLLSVPSPFGLRISPRGHGTKQLLSYRGSLLWQNVSRLARRGRIIFNWTLFIGDLKPDYSGHLGEAVDPA